MKPIVQEVLVDLVLEDVLTDGQLFEFNPYHNERGQFTSKDAAAAYASGAMAMGRAAGLKAKAQGLDREVVRAAIKTAMEKHAESGKGREEGQAKLDLIRTKVSRGTIPGQTQTRFEKNVEKIKAGQKAISDQEKQANLDHLKTTIDGIKAAVKAAPTALPAKDAAYVNALLKPETDQWKREAKAGNIDRVLEHDAAGKLKLSDETRSALKAARAELTKGLKAAPKAEPVSAQTKQTAEFLGKWSRGKEIAKVPGFKEFYRSGKYMTKLTRDEVDALLKGGIAKGTVDRFTVPKVKKTKADREAELD